METLNSDNFQSTINSENLVLIDFSAQWCGPCKVMGPILDSLSGEVEGMDFYKVDIDTDPEIANEYGVSGVPTLLIFKEGKPIAEHVGLAPKGALKDGFVKLVKQQKLQTDEQR